MHVAALDSSRGGARHDTPLSPVAPLSTSPEISSSNPPAAVPGPNFVKHSPAFLLALPSFLCLQEDGR
ncbi:unnamed protein product [Linum trigynum]|uniref:Uncharacterized protein n=1 Tax=Linum trigynum TaxID=586398 RepID=A0AAV2ET92_9ROSI